MAGKGLVTPDGSFAVRYPPGYPLLLAGILELARVTSARESVLFLSLNGLVVLAIPLLIFGIASTVFDQSTALLAGALAATYPLYLWLTKQPNTEIPFLPVFLLSLYLFVGCLRSGRLTAWSGFLIGALVGLASLVRPFVIALSCVLLVALWIAVRTTTVRQRVVFSLLLLLGNALIVLPWEVWARQENGQWLLLSTNGPPSAVDGLTFALKECAAGRTLDVSPEVHGLMQEVRNRSGEFQSVPAIGRFLASKFVNSPSPVSSLIFLKARRAWYASDSQSRERLVALLQTPYLLFAALGGILAAKSGLGQRRLALMVLLVTLYFWTLTIVVLSIVRYMVPAMLLLMPFVAFGLITAGKTARESYYRWQRKSS